LARERSELIGRAVECLTAGTAFILLSILPCGARTASLSVKDLLVLGRAIAFMQPVPGPDAVIAVAYAPGDPASRQDADAIMALIGGGLSVGQSVLKARLIDSTNSDRAGFQIVIAAVGANGPRLSVAARAARALCVTSETEAVRAGVCAMAIRSEPRVEILVNHAASSASGIEFAAAFRMMIQEI
jgi:hypothetical protein